jgi:hypothetical protein
VNHESVAEQVLAEVQQQHPEGLQPEAPQEAEPSPEVQAMVDAMAEDGAEVEIEEQAEGEAPKKRGLSWEQAVKSVPPDIAKLMRSMQASAKTSSQNVRP